jgi:hypothetical protein
MRMLIAALFTSCALGACVTPTIGGADYESAFRLWREARSRTGYSPYNSVFIDAQNAQRLDDDSGCYEKGVGVTVNLILVVGATGKIERTFADNSSEKANCFRKAYLGAQMPTPPFSPIPMKLTMH